MEVTWLYIVPAGEGHMCISAVFLGKKGFLMTRQNNIPISGEKAILELSYVGILKPSFPIREAD